MPGPLDIISDWLLATAALIGTGLTGLLGAVRGNRNRSLKNERQLEGDPGDPHSPGVLQISKRNGEKIDELGVRMEEQHRSLMDRVDELGDD